MTTDPKTYLATQIISEKQTVSYRNVARALKVHVNAAKCMLYEFHQDQNKRKPGSIYATYLLAGTKKPVNTIEVNGQSNGVHHDGDEPMPSSLPPFSSSMLQASQDTVKAVEDAPKIQVRTITLVREENLEKIQDEYEDITSSHIYSLSPGKLADLVTLIDIGRGLYTDVFAKEDPLTHNKQYGVIQNSQVRRRKGKRPVIPDAPAPKFQPVKNEPKPATSSTTTSTTKTPALKREDSSRPSSRDSTSTKDSTKPTLKRDASDLFKAFAKSKKPELKPSTSEDTQMSNADDDEGQSEDEALFLDTNTRKSSTKKRPSEVNKDRVDKAAKLRKMMDSDDDEPAVPDVETATGIKKAPVTAMEGGASAQTKADKKIQDDEDADVAWSDSDTEKQRKTAPGTDQSTNKDSGEMAEATGPKRRRGKRKVMKKRTMKDEDGYLVTKEEEAWESFSEDEPEPKQQKPKPVPSLGRGNSGGSQKAAPTGTASAKGGGKKAAAGGGGNIMSFFGKK